MLYKTYKVILILTMVFTIALYPINSLASSDNNTQQGPAPNIVASTAVVIEASTGQVLFDKNKDRQMNPASITKILTALMVIDQFEPNDLIEFGDSAVNGLPADSSRIGARLGEILTVDQSLHGLMLMSANEVALALAEAHSGSLAEFSNNMNSTAMEIGASNSHFVNPHGMYNSNHYSTAMDMALITREAILSDYFLEIMSHATYSIEPTNKCDEIRYLAQKHKMLNDKKDLSIYREDVIAGKSGYTSESGHTLVTVSENLDRQVIVVIMNSDANNIYEDTRKLIDYGYSVPLTQASPEVSSSEDVVQSVAQELTQEAMDTNDVTLDMASYESLDGNKDKANSWLTTLLWIIPLLCLAGIILAIDQRRSKQRRARLARRNKVMNQVQNR